MPESVSIASALIRRAHEEGVGDIGHVEIASARPRGPQELDKRRGDAGLLVDHGVIPFSGARALSGSSAAKPLPRVPFFWSRSKLELAIPIV